MDFTFFGYDTFDAATNMAIDEALIGECERSGRHFIRFYNFKKPAIILSISDHYDNIKKDKGIDVTRRKSSGKPIYVDENILAYSIIAKIDGVNPHLETLESIHKYFGSMTVDAIMSIVDKSCKIEVGEVFSININGMPVAGHGQKLTLGHSAMYHGVIAVKPWNTAAIREFLNLKREYDEELDRLPSVSMFINDKDNKEDIKKELASAMLRKFTSGSFMRMGAQERENVLKDADILVKRTYGNSTWIKNSDVSKLKTDFRFCLLHEKTVE